MSEKRCAACGCQQLLRYDRSQRRWFCLSKIHCDERRQEWYRKREECWGAKEEKKKKG